LSVVGAWSLGISTGGLSGRKTAAKSATPMPGNLDEPVQCDDPGGFVARHEYDDGKGNDLE